MYMPCITGGEYNIPKVPFPVTDTAQNISHEQF